MFSLIRIRITAREWCFRMLWLCLETGIRRMIKLTMARPMNLLDVRYASLAFFLTPLAFPLTRLEKARGLRNANIPTKARVTYFAEKSLKVELQYKKEDEWTPCFDVPNVKLPGVTYLGFSAETGELSDNHDIIKVETKNLYSPSGAAGTPKDYSKNAYKPNQYKKEGSSGGWGWFFLKFILFGLVVVGGYVGFTVLRANRRRDRF